VATVYPVPNSWYLTRSGTSAQRPIACLEHDGHSWSALVIDRGQPELVPLDDRDRVRIAGEEEGTGSEPWVNLRESADRE
jgi:hypothetical protein